MKNYFTLRPNGNAHSLLTLQRKYQFETRRVSERMSLRCRRLALTLRCLQRDVMAMSALRSDFHFSPFVAPFVDPLE